jgi:hypothetical protein
MATVMYAYITEQHQHTMWLIPERSHCQVQVEKNLTGKYSLDYQLFCAMTHLKNDNYIPDIAPQNTKILMTQIYT